MQKPLIIALALATFVAGIALGIANRQQPAVMQAGTVLTPPRDITPFSLQSAAETSFDNNALAGRWTLVFFGFTNCPDICPATLQLLSTAREALRAEDASLALPDILLISVDPQRDSAEALARYAAYFGDAVIGATGSDDEIASLAADLGIVYARVPMGNDGGYTMDHSGTVLLIDPEVRLRAVFSPPLSSTAIANDLRIIIESSS